MTALRDVRKSVGTFRQGPLEKREDRNGRRRTLVGQGEDGGGEGVE